ncbi:MAG: imidazole glycerol phosphate synthase subunit HisH [Oscillospiraceae bacterium]|nr:imidazole glycerol phosphate synthase subunit HisH [Candidatus Limimonas egerieequi]
MVAVIDYGVGNLFSLCCSLEAIGADSKVTNDPDEIRRADKIILPGVGAFEDAARKLHESGLDQVVIDEANSGKPLLGICLGMQMLFEESHEYGSYKGLGLLKGSIEPLKGFVPDGLKIPQMGWNKLIIKKDNPIFKYIKNDDYVYFVHSYYAHATDDSVIATTEYGVEVTAAVSKGNIFGCQFHPEKSGDVGLKILKAFCEEGNV